MTTEIRVSKYSISDDTDLRILEFEVGTKTISTPIRALNTNTFFRETRIPRSLSNLNEIYFKFDDDSLKVINENRNASRKKNNVAYKSKTQANHAPTLSILEFKNLDASPRYPTETEIEILINTAYAFSDITPIPSIPKIARTISMENFDEFLGYLKACYDNIMIRNKKKILGYIPVTAPQFTRKIIDFYLDHGINAYYIDFDGTLISSHLTELNAMKVQLAKRGYEESNFIHYVNVSFGKSINDEEVLSARDLLGFGHGLDSLGGIHVGAKRNRQFYEWLKTQKDIQRNTNRLLNRDDYGYYRVDLLGERLSRMIPRDAPVNPSDILSTSDSRQTRAVKIVNLHQQCVEANVLKTLVDENPDNTLEYFKSKPNVLEDDIKRLSKSSRP